MKAKITMSFFRSIIILGLFIPTLSIANPQYLQVKAQQGDGVLSLLQTYQLKAWRCNIDQFYTINNLAKDSPLSVNQAYLLPILVYQYDGRSIRSTININDRPLAERIQVYNERMHQRQLLLQDYRVGLVLWVPFHELYCPHDIIQAYVDVSPDIPQNTGQVPSRDIGSIPNRDRMDEVNTGNIPEKELPSRGVYELFGKDYANVPLRSKSLQGRVYYIVSGHGGPDPGAVGKNGDNNLCEDEYAYDIALRLARNLLSHGAIAYVITRDNDDGIREGEFLPCDKDEVCWPNEAIPITQKERLKQRSDAINDLYRKNKRNGINYQRLVVLHIDVGAKRQQVDTYFYHKSGDDASKALSELLRETFETKYYKYRKVKAYSGTTRNRNLHMLRETLPTSVFLELGNIQNNEDQGRLIIAGNRQLMANWISEGLMRDN